MKNQPIDTSKRSAMAYVSLGSILVLALFLRLYGIDWGLPNSDHPYYSYHPDEVPLLFWSEWLSQGHLVAKQFIYGGTFYFLILRACIYFGSILTEVVGGFNILASAILMARYLQVFLALLTILLVYECGRLFYDRKTGLIAALIMALVPAHIVATQNVRPDAISAFLVALIIFLAAKLLRSELSERRKLLIYSGMAIGAAAAFRLPLIGFGLLPVVAYIIARQQTLDCKFLRLVFDWSTFWFCVTIVLTYIVLSPHSLMFPEMFVAGIETTMKYETGVFPDAMDRGPIFFQYAWRIFHQALGYPVYFLALGGLVYALVRRRAEDNIVLIGVGLYFIMLSSVTWTLVRYTLPMLPLLTLLSGVAVIQAFEYVHHVYTRGIIYSAIVFLMAWTLVSDFALLHVVASKNARVQASEWITQNIPRGKSILLVKQYDGDDYFNPVMPPQFNNIDLTLIVGHDSKKFFTEKKIEYVILNEMLYSDMERLSSMHPREEVRDFHEVIKNTKMKLVKEIKVPVQFFGMDFSRSYAAIDFTVINPGIRIYQMP